ncbi:hypothetical protein BASA50_006984 [Batrachochytrium salamandrivorans]|uniref:ditrans,polycis-polyprenyl diphosphate synthase [(2E,6E)-farnesyldiphosphate specific] n=1 Tax=Batrachochytrium salamandrivorans TaxID=1357716 RepID=A0ABQ8F3N7_9FUNG|nr:hypothetical protein BASA50_008795 [Batrachochytrium salamandrivorans]KAH6594079.1 hypothetical protein BASA50_006984 [Batrachochytrium salamandrivorans]
MMESRQRKSIQRQVYLVMVQAIVWTYERVYLHGRMAVYWLADSLLFRSILALDATQSHMDSTLAKLPQHIAFVVDSALLGLGQGHHRVCAHHVVDAGSRDVTLLASPEKDQTQRLSLHAGMESIDASNPRLRKTHFHFQNSTSIPSNISNDSMQQPTRPSDIHGHPYIGGVIASIVDTIQMCIIRGIEQFTLYDQLGIFKLKAALLIDRIEQTIVSPHDKHAPQICTLRIFIEGTLFWEQSVSGLHDVNGVLLEKKSDLTIYIKSQWDGKDALVRIVRDLSQEAHSCSMSTIKERILEDFPIHSDPDLVYIIGGGIDQQLYNFSPWSIRLAEFYHVPCLNYYGRIDTRDIRQGMVKYAKCEQRFGK